MLDKQTVELGFDRPLSPNNALQEDKLGRIGFAQAAVNALGRVGSTDGFVLSVEGGWGSGKTSTLAMMQALLKVQQDKPIIVHFNPWLVGDRDALLRHFLSKISSEIKMTDYARDGKKVARELLSYSKVFDVLKLVPGAEPWAALIKTVIDASGDAAGSIAEYKTPDIEASKRRVEKALRDFKRPIFVFIDDIDRLFPSEVFEMVRIIKAVGDLPNVGYILAWDPIYVTDALESVNVPRAAQYLDKIVQVRLPLPAISFEARGKLINEALLRLHPDASLPHFPNGENRLQKLYFSGLREMFEQPRDFARVFNTVVVLEPALRGEVVLADIIGFAAIMVKAPLVYELLTKEPRWFVGALPSDHGFVKSEDILKDGENEREAVFSKCSTPNAVRKLIYQLFPMTADPKRFFMDRVIDFEGHIAAPSRLLVALQLHASGEDVSFVLARRYMMHADQRAEITSQLTQNNCISFVECLGDIAESTGASGVDDIDQLCVDIGRSIDTESFIMRSKNRAGFFELPAEDVAYRAINSLIRAAAPSRASAIAELIIKEPRALTVAMEILTNSFIRDKRDQEHVLCSHSSKRRLTTAFVKNVIDAANSGRLLSSPRPGFILWGLSKIAPGKCSVIFQALKSLDPTLDEFALAIMGTGYDTVKGERYSLPADRSKIEAYCQLDKLKVHAKSRLKDKVELPALAAWNAVIEEKSFYGVDGSLVRD